MAGADRVMRSAIAGAMGAALLLALPGCHRKVEDKPPPRADDPVLAQQKSSILTAPIEGDAAIIRRAIETAVPRTLWSIDQPAARCIPPQRIKLFGKRIKVTPPIKCTITGIVTRGPIRLRGEGQDIVADMPIRAQITARDVGGRLKGETATGAAMAHARIRLDLTPGWALTGKIGLHYDWTTPPGIDFLGQRIGFADQADEKLQPIVRQLERDLPRELARVQLRPKVEQLWRQGFATLGLNARDPAVWMRVTPQKLLYGGYALRGDRLRLDLGLEAITESFVGPRPTDPQPIPLPPPSRTRANGRFTMAIPVTADYAQLEPVILRALTKRAAQPFTLPAIGPVTARFDTVEAYGTTDGRIAVGITLAVHPASGRIGDTHGRIWLVARPVNNPNSAEVRFTDLTVTGATDRVAGDMLVALGSSPGFSQLIATSLTQNFTRDLDNLQGKIRRAIAEKRLGDLLINSRIDRMETGQIHAYGAGLHLPVEAQGTARIRYQPARR
ncbi:DUF4403 family protein [Sphingobium sp. BYY-5]|uniref:DUF4403 family protein n=1 Tax=Sphingobium sp. BYY-5 TaxID=2926400 RepID=UPI001FA701DF|nr:DUF4403 family protein [Sphingobium sp. BYY-5]MCI4589811.1 DUF4403 family protein [Sphingobium sp. BYY-5]